MRVAMSLLVLGFAVIALSGCGGQSSDTATTSLTSTATTTSTETSTDASTTISSGAKSKWSVGRQLIADQPWGSEGVPEKELQDNVKEAESTPDQRLVLALNDLGAWYRAQHRYEDAENIYKRVLALQISRLGPNHYDLTYTHNDLGVVYYDANKHEDAEKEFLKAIDAGVKAESAVCDDDEAQSRHSYALLLRKMGRGEEADKQEEKAAALSVKRQTVIDGMGR